MSPFSLRSSVAPALPGFVLFICATVASASQTPVPRQMITNLRTHGTVHPQGNQTRSFARTLATDNGQWEALSIAGRSGHAAIYDPSLDRMIVFGGDDGVFLNDVWSLRFSSAPPWTELHAAGNPPEGLAGGRAIYDAPHDRMLIVGGWDSGPTNNVWSLSLSNQFTWTHMNPTGTPPAPCGSCPACLDAAHDRVIVISDAVWALSLSGAGAWTQLAATSPYPTDRFYASAMYDPVRDRVLVFGGDDGNFPLPSDVWALSLSGTPTWSQLTVAGAPPLGRYGATTTYDPNGDRMILFGGSDTYGFFNDTWSLSLSGSPAWTELSPAGGPPRGRVLHTAVYDSMRQRMVIFGGADDVQAGTDRSDVWALSLDGPAVWTPVPGTSPEARRAASAIYDPVRSRMLIFGGMNWPAMFDGANDVWSFSMGALPGWVELHPTGALPPERYDALAIYDTPRDRMVVFGGSGGGSGLSDLWALSLAGTPSWLNITPAGAAPPTASAAVYDPVGDRMVAIHGADVWTLPLSAPQWTLSHPPGNAPGESGTGIYDPVRHRVVVFGPPAVSDVWALALGGPLQWSHILTSGGAPPPRSGQLAVYDVVRDRMVIHGGWDTNENNEIADAWALSFAGATWTQLPSRPSAPVAAHTGMYDAANDRMLVFGGGDFYAEYNELWALDWGGPTTTPLASFHDALHPAYPNPFNPRVTIPFELRQDGNASLLVYDVSGQLVRTLVSEWTSRGSHAVTWDGTGNAGTGVSSGIYFCRLQTGDFTETRKLVLLK